MSIALLCILLIPIDIFISSSKEGQQTLSQVSKIISIDQRYFPKIMLLLYFICIIFTFILIPFAFFYTSDINSINEKEDIFTINTDYNKHSSICTSLKYTSIFLIFIILLLTCGLYFRENPLLIQIHN